MRNRHDSNAAKNVQGTAQHRHYQRALKKRPIGSIASTPVPRIASVDALRGFSMICILGLDIMVRGLAEMLAQAGPFFAAIGAAISLQFTHVSWEGAYF